MKTPPLMIFIPWAAQCIVIDSWQYRNDEKQPQQLRLKIQLQDLLKTETADLFHHLTWKKRLREKIVYHPNSSINTNEYTNNRFRF